MIWGGISIEGSKGDIFALKANIKRIGIANCIIFSREMKIIKEYLSKDFEVFNVDCKYGHLSKQELLGGASFQILCNPAGQADFLNTKKTGLNISMGLCIGHDMIFNQKSIAPVTNLFIKDFTNNHNSAKAVNKIEYEIR